MRKSWKFTIYGASDTLTEIEDERRKKNKNTLLTFYLRFHHTHKHHVKHTWYIPLNLSICIYHIRVLKASKVQSVGTKRKRLCL